MQILKVKNITEFESAEVPADSLLVLLERQSDGSYLWRCKDSENNTGTIGTGVESVNAKTGPNVVLEHSDLGAVAEDLNAEYGRPDTLLSQMMFFIRNGAVNLYATLADLKNFLAGYFAALVHGHAISDVTNLQTTLDGKTDTVAFTGFQVIIQGQSDQLFSTLSEAVAHINTLDLSGLQGIVINCAAGTYNETEPFVMPDVRAHVNLNGAVITFAGGLVISATTTLKNGRIIGDVSFANGYLTAELVNFTGNITANRSIELISCGVTGDITVESGQMLVASRLAMEGRIVSAGELVIGGCSRIIAADDSNPAVSSTGGYVFIVDTLVANYGGGGDINCDNGAANPPNMISNVYCYTGTITAGNAVTMLASVYVSSPISGSAVIWVSAPGEHTHIAAEITDFAHSHSVSEVANLQTLLDGKAASGHNHDTIYAAIDHSHSEYALTGHDHNGVYSVTGHDHNGVYSAVGHSHAIADVSDLQAELDGKQTKAAAHNLGTGLTGAISLDIANGDTQCGALSGAATLAYGAISNLEEGQGFILQLDNAAGQTFEFTAETTGSILLLDAGSTGIYKIAFSKVNGKIYYDGKSEVYC